MSMSGGAIAPASSAAAITANERFMAVFWDLASLNPQARTDAASRLIKYLTSIQSSLTDSSQTSKSNASSADSDPSPFPELAYALKRLLRGLSSSRDAARQGFALALAEMLRQFPQISLKDYVSQLSETHPVGGKPKGQEERDRLYARVFSYAALVRSERIKTEYETKPKSTFADLAQSVVTPLINDLFQLSSKKFFVTEMCFYIICTLIQSHQVPTNEFIQHILPLFVSKMNVDPETQFTPEQLWVTIQINHSYGIDWSQYLPTYWQSGSIVQSVHLRLIKPALSAAVYTTPKLHSVWALVLRDVFSSKDSSTLLQDFWTSVVDELFASSQSAQLMAMQILEAVFPNLHSADQVAFVFTRNCLRTLTNALQFRNHHLNRPARRFLAVVEREAKKSPIVAVAVVTALQGNSVGSKSFDQRTGTRIVHSLLGLMDADSAKSYISSLVKEFYKPSEEFKKTLAQEQAAAAAAKAASAKAKALKKKDKDAMEVDGSGSDDEESDESEELPELDEDTVDLQQMIDGRRHWVLNQLFSIAKGGGPVAEKEHEVLVPVLRFFFFHAFFDFIGENAAPAATTPNKKNQKQKGKAAPAPAEQELLPTRVRLEPSLTEATRKLCQDRLYSLLGQLSNATQPSVEKEASPASKKAPVVTKANGEAYLYELLKYQIETLEKETNNFVAVTPLKPVEDEDDSDDDDDKPEPTPFLQIREDAMQLLQKIKARCQLLEKKGTSEDIPRLRAFEQLFLHLLLQLNVDPEDAAQNLTELSQGYKDIFEKKPDTPSKKKLNKSPIKKALKQSKPEEAEDDDAEEEPSGPIEIMTDILVGLLLKPSAILRDVVENAFKTVVCDQITPAALRVLLNAVKEDASGLLVGEGEGEGDDDGEDSDELDSDEVAEVMEELGSDDEAGSASGDDDDDEESEEEEPQPVKKSPAKKDDKKPQNKKSEPSSESEEEDESDDEGMTDAQMFAMDKHIAAVLKQQKESRRSQRDTQQQLLHFKFRVLDLIDVFLKRQSDNVLIFETIRPLLDAIQEASKAKEQSALLQRVASTFNTKLCKLKTYPRGDNVDVAALYDLVGDLLLMATKTKLGVLADSACHGIQLLLRVIAGQQKSLNVTSVANKLTDALKSFTRNHNSQLRPSFFQDLLQKQAALGWALFPELVDVVENSRPGFTRVQVFMLYNTIVTKRQLETPELKKQFIKYAPTIRKAFMSCLNDSKIKAAQMKHVLRTASQVFKHMVAVFGAGSSSALEQARSLWDSQSLIQTLSGLYGEFFSKSAPLARQCEQLISQISGQAVKIQAAAPEKAATKPEKVQQQNPKKRKADSTPEKKAAEPAPKKAKVVEKSKSTAKTEKKPIRPKKTSKLDSSDE